MNNSKCEVCCRGNDEVSLLIQGKDGKCLCNECIRVYSDLLSNYSWTATNSSIHENKILKPHEIKNFLDKKVIGQDKAKIALSVAIYNHELFIAGKLKCYKKSNILLLGSTGVGKTLLVETIAKIIDIPIVICDATTYSEVGYVGSDVNQILEMLYFKSNSDIKKMQHGIVFLDEIDKIGSSDLMQSYGRDVSGVGVQQALLKMIEGKMMTFNITEKGIDKTFSIDTSNILFVFSGTFVGLKKDVFLDDALINFGMLPEFIGRSDYIIQLNDLCKNDLIHIMKDVDDSLCNIYIELFKADKINLSFDSKAIDLIADLALSKKLGARALFAIFTNLLSEVRYNSILNNIKSVVITEDLIKSTVFT